MILDRRSWSCCVLNQDQSKTPYLEKKDQKSKGFFTLHSYRDRTVINYVLDNRNKIRQKRLFDGYLE